METFRSSTRLQTTQKVLTELSYLCLHIFQVTDFTNKLLTMKMHENGICLFSHQWLRSCKQPRQLQHFVYCHHPAFPARQAVNGMAIRTDRSRESSSGKVVYMSGITLNLMLDFCQNQHSERCCMVLGKSKPCLASWLSFTEKVQSLTVPVFQTSVRSPARFINHC